MEIPNYEEPLLPEPFRNAGVNWNHLFYFTVIATHCSIKVASETLGLSPSTLSQHLGQLEKDLGVLLFSRKIRQLTLTSAGQRLFIHTRHLFENSQRLLGIVSPLKLGTYPVAVGLVPSPSLQIAYDIIGDFQEEYASVGMKLRHSVYSQLETGLINSEFDFGFSDRPPERADLHSELLTSSELKFYVSAQIPSRPFSSLIKDLPMLICNAEHGQLNIFERFFKESGLDVCRTVTSDFPSVLLQLCERGLGIGLFAKGSTGQLSSGEFRSLRSPPDAPKLHDRIYVMWLKDSERSDVVQKLKLLLRKRIR
jgi:DNA-binding transcriptional LysR family regulator